MTELDSAECEWWKLGFVVTFLFCVAYHISVGFPNVIYVVWVYRNFLESYLRSKFGGKQQANECRISSRVWLSWIDDMSRLTVNNGMYLLQFERGRRDWFARNGITQLFHEKQIGVVLTAINTKYHCGKASQSLQLLDKFWIVTKLIYYNEKHLYLEQKIVSSSAAAAKTGSGSDANVICTAFAQISVVDFKLKKKTKSELFMNHCALSQDEKDELKCLTSELKELSHWIKSLQESSAELRKESGLKPKTI